MGHASLAAGVAGRLVLCGSSTGRNANPLSRLHGKEGIDAGKGDFRVSSLRSSGEARFLPGQVSRVAGDLGSRSVGETRNKLPPTPDVPVPKAPRPPRTRPNGPLRKIRALRVLRDSARRTGTPEHQRILLNPAPPAWPHPFIAASWRAHMIFTRMGC